MDAWLAVVLLAATLPCLPFLSHQIRKVSERAVLYVCRTQKPVCTHHFKNTTRVLPGGTAALLAHTVRPSPSLLLPNDASRAILNDGKLVRILLRAGGDPNQADIRGRTPAMAAALRGDRDLLECLTKHGARLSSVNSDGRTATFFAAMNGHVECLAFVIDECDGLDAIAAADARDSSGCTPLWTAAAHSHLETVQYLARRGASPDVRDVTGTSAAWMAAGSGNAPCLGALLEAGADGNLANEDGLTPTLIAAQGGHANCLRMLAAAGADLGSRDFAGNSAAAFAAMGGHLCCLEVSFGCEIGGENTACRFFFLTYGLGSGGGALSLSARS